MVASHRTVLQRGFLVAITFVALSPVGVWSQQANQHSAEFEVQSPHPGQVGPIPVSVCPRGMTTLTLTSASQLSASMPMVLAIAAATATGSLTTAGGQHVDLDLSSAELYSAAFPGLWNSFFRMSPYLPYIASTLWRLSYATDGAAQSYAVQTAVVNPASADGMSLSAAYSVSRSPFTLLQLPNDGFAQVNLASWAFPFYDVAYSSVFVSSNGRLTFGSGSPSTFFSFPSFQEPPSVFFLWGDLDPSYPGAAVMVCNDEGTRQLTCRFSAVPEINSLASLLSTATVTLGGDIPGQIVINYENCPIRWAMVGVFPGSIMAPPPPALVDFTSCNTAGCPANPVPGGAIRETFIPPPIIPNPFDLSYRTLTFLPTSFAPANRYVAFLQ